MTKDQMNRLTSEGIHAEESFERLGNSMELLDTVAAMFPQDRAYEKMINGVENEDYQLAYEGTHTLKSLAGNMSMHKLYDLCSKQCDLYKKDDIDGALAMIIDIADEYERVIRVLEEVL